MRPVLRHALAMRRNPPRATARILVKRYARSRLYDAVNGRYVSIDDLRRWRESGVSFVVRDVETGADVTRDSLS